MKRKELVKLLERGGFLFERHGGMIFTLKVQNVRKYHVTKK